MSEKDRQKYDRDFKRLCRWFEEAGEMANVLREQCRVIEQTERAGYGEEASYSERGIRNALAMLDFLTELYKTPQDYEGANDDQKDLYPDIAFGLMSLALAVGQMRINDESESVFGY